VDSNGLIGPAVLRPDGYVVYFGATGNINLADANLAVPTWTAGPSLPGGNVVADGPAALMPNGNIMVQASPAFSAPSQFFVFESNNTLAGPIAAPPLGSANYVASYEGRFLVLPSGQLLWSNDGQSGHPEVAIYTPKGHPLAAWKPKVTVPTPGTTLLTPSTGNALYGKKFNGWSQGATSGNIAQESTNYPIVRITNNASGHVCFGHSYNFKVGLATTMGVWTAATMNALFDLPSGCDTGASLLQVIVNGIPSKGTYVIIAV
jgi:hypothetical protein